MQEVALKIEGNASGKSGSLKVTTMSPSTSLMDFLRSNGWPIASSCYGEGVCKKCVVTLNGEEVMSCRVDIHELDKNNAQRISVDYL